MRVGRDFTFNAQSNVLHFGASEILLKDMFAYPSDPNFDELGSLELTGAFGDEVNQWSEKAKDIVTSRIRYKLDQFGIIPKFLLTCNPAKNWVYRDFFHPWRQGRLESHRAFIPALVTDNPAFAPTKQEDGTLKDHPYVASLKRLKGPDRERLLLGNWDYDDNPWALMSTDAILGMYSNTTATTGLGSIIWDVAGPGSDRSVAVRFDGFRAKEIKVWPGEDINEHARMVDNMARAHNIQRHRLVVDATGIGTGPAQLLRGCYAYNGGASPILNKDFRNLKSEASFALAQVVNDGLMAIDTTDYQDEVMRELGMISQWKGEADGKIMVIPKQEVRKELGMSPDIADPFVMRMALELIPSTEVFEQSIANATQRIRGRAHRARMDEIASRFPTG